MPGGIVAAGLLALAAAVWVPGRPPRPRRPEEPTRSTGGLLRVLGLLGVVGMGYAVLGGLAGLLVGAVAAGFAWKGVTHLEGLAEQRRGAALQHLAPLVADLVASALAAGRDPGSALRLAAEAAGAEAADELAVFSATLALGADPAAVWRTLAEHPQFGGVGRAFLRATETGSSVTEAMRRGAEDLREVDRSVREAAARTVSTRAAAPLGLCLLPAFVVVGIVPLIAGAVAHLLR